MIYDIVVANLYNRTPLAFASKYPCLAFKSLSRSYVNEKKKEKRKRKERKDMKPIALQDQKSKELRNKTYD